MIDPTETSRLRVIRTIACAAATMARIEAFDAMTVRFWTVRNCGVIAAKTAPSSTRKAMTPETRSLSATSAKARLGTGAGIASGGMGRPLSGRGGHDPLLGRLGPRDLGDDPSFGDDENAVAHRQNLRQIGGDQDDREPAVGEARDDLVYLRLG